MRNHSSIFSFKPRDPFAAILIFVASVIVLETGLAFLPQNKLVRTFRADTLPPASPDWQIMGDSVAQGGIKAPELGGYLTNQFVYNAAIAGTGPEFTYFMLNRQIAAGKAPKAIIYAPSPHTFASKRVALLVGGYCRWGEIFQVARTGLDFPDVVYGVLCKLSYTLRYREQLGNLLRGRPAFDAEDAPDTPDVAPANNRPVKHYTAANLHPMYKKRFVVQEFNRMFLKEFLRLAQEHNIRVYWVTMPVVPAVYESRRQFQFDRDYFAFLEDLEKRYNVRCLQKSFIVLDDENFKDSTHLNRAAAERFTRFLGQKLSELQSQKQAAARNAD